MQYRVYDRQTLRYKDGGYVVSYTIDDDYIVNNNSTITCVKKNVSTDTTQRVLTETVETLYDKRLDRYYIDKTYVYNAGANGVSTIKDMRIASGEGRIIDFNGNQYTIRFLSKYHDTAVSVTVEFMFETENDHSLANVLTGDVIALIQDSGAFHKGVITSVDPTALSISYRSDKELFNDNILNPLRENFAGEDNDVKIAGKFGVDIVIEILSKLFAETDDEYKRLPCIFQSNGDVLDENSEPKMLWTWSDDSINTVDWLTQLFEKYNLVLSWNIDFDIAQEDLSKRQAKYIVTLSAITNSGGIIKDNVDMQTITYTAQELPSATVCQVIDSETKEIILESSGVNLLDPKRSQDNTLLDKKHNTKHETADSEGNTLSSYIAVTPVEKDENGNETYNDYTFTMWNVENSDERYVWCYDKSKTRICAKPYTPANKPFALSPYDIVKGRNTINAKFANEDGSLILQEGETTQEEAENRLIKSVKYIRICYSSEAQVQYQKDAVNKYSDVKYDPYDQPAIYYLFERSGDYKIYRKNQAHDIDLERVLPVKTVVASYNSSSESGNETTPYDVAKEKLVPSKFNQAIEIRIANDSKMFDFQNAMFGDLYKIINERGTIDSVYTGKKITSKERWTTLYFGLGRQKYTDITQIRLRRRLYNEVYNQ